MDVMTLREIKDNTIPRLEDMVDWFNGRPTTPAPEAAALLETARAGLAELLKQYPSPSSASGTPPHPLVPGEHRKP